MFDADVDVVRDVVIVIGAVTVLDINLLRQLLDFCLKELTFLFLQ
jgi:hypothetical protein